MRSCLGQLTTDLGLSRIFMLAALLQRHAPRHATHFQVCHTIRFLPNQSRSKFAILPYFFARSLFVAIAGLLPYLICFSPVIMLFLFFFCFFSSFFSSFFVLLCRFLILYSSSFSSSSSFSGLVGPCRARCVFTLRLGPRLDLFCFCALIARSSF